MPLDSARTLVKSIRACKQARTDVAERFIAMCRVPSDERLGFHKNLALIAIVAVHDEERRAMKHAVRLPDGNANDLPSLARTVVTDLATRRTTQTLRS